MYIPSLHHSFTSSSPSLFGLPLFVFHLISPNTTSFTSLLSSILHTCPDKFNFLSLTLCTRCFFCYTHSFSYFFIRDFCGHLTFRILRWPLISSAISFVHLYTFIHTY